MREIDVIKAIQSVLPKPVTKEQEDIFTYIENNKQQCDFIIQNQKYIIKYAAVSQLLSELCADLCKEIFMYQHI